MSIALIIKHKTQPGKRDDVRKVFRSKMRSLSWLEAGTHVRNWAVSNRLPESNATSSVPYRTDDHTALN